MESYFPTFRARLRSGGNYAFPPLHCRSDSTRPKPLNCDLSVFPEKNHCASSEQRIFFKIADVRYGIGGMRLHSLQHVPFEDLAHVEVWARGREHKVSRTLPFNNDPLPQIFGEKVELRVLAHLPDHLLIL
jgi:hypothetical protein